MKLTSATRDRRASGANPLPRASIVIVATALAVASPHAFAAETQKSADTDSDRGMLEEVVVTAQKREQSSRDVPIAISAFSAARLEQLNLTSTYDLALTTPGLVTASQAGNATPFLRGVGSSIAFTGADSSVSTYVDGYYIAYDQGTMQELYDAERVEVLKGPQATLYGRNAVGGAINYISKQPSTEALAGKIELGYGTESKKEGKLYLTGPLTESLAFGVALLARSRDSYITLGSPAPAGIEPKETRYAGRAKLLWQPTENYRAELAFALSRKDSFEDSVYIPVRGSSLEASAIGAPVTYADSDTLLTGSDVQNDVHQKMATLTQTATFAGDLTFRSLTGFIDTRQAADIPLGGSSVPILSVGDYFGLGSRQFSQEFQFLSAPGDTLTWIVGANYFHSRDGTGPGYAMLPLASAALGLFATEFRQAKQMTDSIAGFAEGTYHATDRLALVLGVRYTRDKRSIEDSYNWFEGIPNPSPFFDCTFAGLTFGVNCGGASLGLPPIPAAFVGAGSALNGVRQPVPQTDKTWSEPTYRATLQYQFADSTNVYFTHARGFKSGVYNIPALQTTGNLPVDPEILKSYELGLKSEFLDRRVSLNSAVFHYKLSGTQAQVITANSGGQASLTTAGNSSIKGAEAELMVAASNRLTLSAGVSYLDTKYEDFVGYPANVPQTPGGGTTGAGGNVTVSESVVGNPLVYTPKWTANTTASYEASADWLSAGASLTATGVYSWTDEYCLEPACRGVQDSYSVLNASLTFRSASDRWSATVYGDNLLDEKYFVNYLQLSTGDLGRFAQGANGGVRVEYAF